MFFFVKYGACVCVFSSCKKNCEESNWEQKIFFLDEVRNIQNIVELW